MNFLETVLKAKENEISTLKAEIGATVHNLLNIYGIELTSCEYEKACRKIYYVHGIAKYISTLALVETMIDKLDDGKSINEITEKEIVVDTVNRMLKWNSLEHIKENMEDWEE